MTKSKEFVIDALTKITECQRSLFYMRSDDADGPPTAGIVRMVNAELRPGESYTLYCGIVLNITQAQTLAQMNDFIKTTGCVKRVMETADRYGIDFALWDAVILDNENGISKEKIDHSTSLSSLFPDFMKCEQYFPWRAFQEGTTWRDWLVPFISLDGEKISFMVSKDGATTCVTNMQFTGIELVNAVEDAMQKKQRFPSLETLAEQSCMLVQ